MELAPAPLPPPSKEGIGLDELLGTYPALRQSILAKYDDCPLSALFEMRYSNGWSTHPQAGGTIFHRFMARYLRTLQGTKDSEGHYEETMEPAEALEILYETVRQRDIPLHDRVRVPLRDMPKLLIAVKKICAVPFSIDRIVDVERRLWAEIVYPSPDPGGGLVTRSVTGQLDLLIFQPPDGAVVVDWKHTWQPPAERKETGELDKDAERRLSYEGYFQQRFYALLVMANYRNVNWVELREYYPLRAKTRRARVTRAQLEHVIREMQAVVEAFDTSVMTGTHVVTRVDGVETLVEVAGKGVEGDAWGPEPGKHCDFCVKPGACPVEREARGEGAITSFAQAEQYAAEALVATRVRKHRLEAAKAWVAAHGSIRVKDSKGRRMLGWQASSDGSRNFDFYVPDESDRGPQDPVLDKLMRDSVADSRRERDAARAARRRVA